LHLFFSPFPAIRFPPPLYLVYDFSGIAQTAPFSFKSSLNVLSQGFVPPLSSQHSVPFPTRFRFLTSVFARASVRSFFPFPIVRGGDVLEPRNFDTIDFPLPLSTLSLCFSFFSWPSRLRPQEVSLGISSTFQDGSLTPFSHFSDDGLFFFPVPPLDVTGGYHPKRFVCSEKNSPLPSVRDYFSPANHPFSSHH